MARNNLLGGSSPRDIKERMTPKSTVTGVKKPEKKSFPASLRITKETHREVTVLKTIGNYNTMEELIHDLVRLKVSTMDETDQNTFKALTK